MKKPSKYTLANFGDVSKARATAQMQSAVALKLTVINLIRKRYPYLYRHIRKIQFPFQDL